MRRYKPFFMVMLLLVGSIALFWSCQPAKADTERKEVPSQLSKESTTNRPVSFEEWFNDPQAMVSAHRGGPYPGYPENAIETFEHVISQTPAIIECDIAMTKDSVLILMHDKTIDRTTTGDGSVMDLTYDEIMKLHLVDNEGDSTAFKVSTLDQALAWGKGKALFTLDVKRGVPFHRVIDAMKAYDAATYAAIITYRIQDATLVHKLDSSIVISVSAGSEGALEQLRKSGIPTSNLLGFVGVREPDEAHYQKLNEMGIKTILGTLGNLDKKAVAKGNDTVYLSYLENGANVIATDRPLEVAKVIQSR